MNEKTFYITTTLPYVNAAPHVGFALELIRADAVARFQALMGKEVFFNTGTDEHGAKIYRKAEEQGISAQEYVDEYAEKFKKLIPLLHISPDIHFIRTTDAHHIEAAQEFWRRCSANGDIYKKTYQVKYCVGCELEKTDSELENGRCPLHPKQDIELIDEENYFFRFSAYGEKLLKLYQDNPSFVVPDFRLNEIRTFVARGLQDFSISRLKSKMPWGVPVPDDEEQVMYVWFDALVNYVSTIGWPTSAKAPAGNATAEGDFEKWWPVVQYAGKDNLRQQSAMWQAMLMSAGLPTSKQIVIDGFITSGGQKMSKSLGNVVDPLEVVSEYGAESLRYYLLREISSFEDGDFTDESFKVAYNGNLANGIGNLVSRIMKMAISNLEGPVAIPEVKPFAIEYIQAFENYNLKVAADYVWAQITELDSEIQRTEPFKLIKTDPEAGKKLIAELVQKLYIIGRLLQPLLPETSNTIKQLIREHKTPAKPLFERK